MCHRALAIASSPYNDWLRHCTCDLTFLWRKSDTWEDQNRPEAFSGCSEHFFQSFRPLASGNSGLCRPQKNLEVTYVQERSDSEHESIPMCRDWAGYCEKRLNAPVWKELWQANINILYHNYNAHVSAIARI